MERSTSLRRCSRSQGGTAGRVLSCLRSWHGIPIGRLPAGRWGLLGRAALAVGLIVVVAGYVMPVISVNLDDAKEAYVQVRNPIAFVPDHDLWLLITPDIAIFPVMFVTCSGRRLVDRSRAATRAGRSASSFAGSRRPSRSSCWASAPASPSALVVPGSSASGLAWIARDRRDSLGARRGRDCDPALPALRDRPDHQPDAGVGGRHGRARDGIRGGRRRPAGAIREHHRHQHAGRGRLDAGRRSRCSSRCDGGSRRWWIGDSTGRGTTPSERPMRSPSSSATRSTWRRLRVALVDDRRGSGASRQRDGLAAARGPTDDRAARRRAAPGELSILMIVASIVASIGDLGGDGRGPAPLLDRRDADDPRRRALLFNATCDRCSRWSAASSSGGARATQSAGS